MPDDPLTGLPAREVMRRGSAILLALKRVKAETGTTELELAVRTIIALRQEGQTELMASLLKEMDRQLEIVDQLAPEAGLGGEHDA